MKTTMIYGLICPKTKKIRYVGKTVDLAKRSRLHIERARQNLQLEGKAKWIRDLISEGLNFEVTVLENCTSENWKEKEVYWIKHFQDLGNNLFNKTRGGEDYIFEKGNIPWNKEGGHYSEGSRLKMRKAKLGTTLPEEHKAKISQSLLGKPKSAEHVRNISIAKGKPVLQFDKEGNFIAEHHSAKAAAMAVGCVRESIRDACNGRIKFCKGFKWVIKHQE